MSGREASKLRLLNGGHLALACLGLLAGCSTVSEALARPGFAPYAMKLMLDEQMPTLPPSDHDIRAYSHQLLARWRNPGIVHQLDRIARDISVKLPTRLLAALRENLQAGRPVGGSVLALAAWMHCASRPQIGRRRIELQDPLADRLAEAASEAGDNSAQRVDRFLALGEVFGDDLPRCVALRSALVRATALLQREGVGPAITACMLGALD